VLEVDDDLHDAHQGVLALVDGVDEALCCLDLFLGIKVGVALFAAEVRAVEVVLAEGVAEGTADVQLWHVAVVEVHDGLAVFFGHYEVGHNGRRPASLVLAQGIAGPWVEAQELCLDVSEAFFVNTELAAERLPVLVDEIVKVFVDHGQCFFLVRGAEVGVCQLEVEALAE